MFNSSALPSFCDAPSYSIVRACGQLGFQEPEDVRWCRLRDFLKEGATGLALFNLQTWKALLSGHQSRRCTCRQHLPTLEKYTFTLLSGRELHFFLGQCPRCRTIFWEEAGGEPV